MNAKHQYKRVYAPKTTTRATRKQWWLKIQAQIQWKITDTQHQQCCDRSRKKKIETTKCDETIVWICVVRCAVAHKCIHEHIPIYNQTHIHGQYKSGYRSRRMVASQNRALCLRVSSSMWWTAPCLVCTGMVFVWTDNRLKQQQQQ